MKNFKEAKISDPRELENYLPNANCMSGVFDIPGTGGFGGIGGGPTGMGAAGLNGMSQDQARLSQPWEMIYNNSYFMLSLLRTALTYAYVIHGPLRTLVDLPPQDAFRPQAGDEVKITTDEVSPEELEAFNRKIKRSELFIKVQNAMRWERLYGGAGLILNSNQNFGTPFNINSIDEKSRVSFIVADRWQLNWVGVPGLPNSNFIYTPGGDYTEATAEMNTARIHQSRVARIVGEEAPALIRQRLQGWGMSVMECVIRQMQLGFKGENAIFELIDEAKVDVWSIDGFNAQTLSKMAMGATSLRLRIATMMKSFLNAIVLDAKDKYEQKQVTFTGMAEMMDKIMILIAAACRMPVSKLFGLASSGFSSGEDDLEVYNSIVERERAKAYKILEFVIPILMMQEWGFVPEDWGVDWPSLRSLTAEEEETVKDSKYTRAKGMLQDGVFTTGKEYADWLKREGILTMETEVGKGNAELQPQLVGVGDEPPDPGEPKKKASQGKDPKKAKD